MAANLASCKVSQVIHKMNTADIVVIGAGVIGAACAFFAARLGLSVIVIERGAIASGTSSAGEGNILVSDKEVGPELDLAIYSQSIWQSELAEYASLWEYQSKGSLMVAASEFSALTLGALAARQREAGIDVTHVNGAELTTYEPHINPELVAGSYYPQDAQVQPMLLVAHLLRLARGLGAIVNTQTEVIGFVRIGETVVGVKTSRGEFSAGHVINATGTWSGEIAELAGVHIPVQPRRGFVVVTEPLPLVVRHKVFNTDYMEDVASSKAGLQTSSVVESTESGTILIGSSRERVGFDRSFSVAAISSMASKAIALFPMLASVKAIRLYHGFRPYCPDHLPIIGPDLRVPGLWHACGHEGAGIGLAPGTGMLLIQAITGEKTGIGLSPFLPERFVDVHD